jgi:hypothetical protein
VQDELSPCIIAEMESGATWGARSQGGGPR